MHSPPARPGGRWPASSAGTRLAPCRPPRPAPQDRGSPSRQTLPSAGACVGRAIIMASRVRTKALPTMNASTPTCHRLPSGSNRTNRSCCRVVSSRCAVEGGRPTVWASSVSVSPWSLRQQVRSSASARVSDCTCPAAAVRLVRTSCVRVRGGGAPSSPLSRLRILLEHAHHQPVILFLRQPRDRPSCRPGRRRGPRIGNAPPCAARLMRASTKMRSARLSPRTRHETPRIKQAAAEAVDGSVLAADPVVVVDRRARQRDVEQLLVHPTSGRPSRPCRRRAPTRPAPCPA